MLFKIITSWSGFLCCWGSQISLSLFSWRRSQGCKIDIFPIAVCLKSWEKYFMSKDLARLNSLCSWLHCISRSQGVSFNWTKFLFLVGGINEHNSLHWCFNIFYCEIMPDGYCDCWTTVMLYFYIFLVLRTQTVKNVFRLFSPVTNMLIPAGLSRLPSGCCYVVFHLRQNNYRKRLLLFPTRFFVCFALVFRISDISDIRDICVQFKFFIVFPSWSFKLFLWTLIQTAASCH